ncbi:MAG: M23 family metallopeptidase [Treponema sp.]|nr:M23 family metallopeptidase [Treponema sp.]
MSTILTYKRLENNAVQKVKRAFILMGRGMGIFFKAIFRGLSKQYTIVLVPHSEKKVYNFHISILAVICVVLALAGGVAALFWYRASSNMGSMVTVTNKDSRLKETQASLDQLREETALVMRAARGFEAALSGALSTLGADMPAFKEDNSGAGGDLSSFFDIQETPEGVLQEVNDMRGLRSYLDSAVEPLKEIGALLYSHSALLTEIPSIWPIKGGIGHISMNFGQNENPFTGQFYIHKGIDLSTYRQGDPIVTTADGQVVTVDFDPGGFGNYVIIKHKHGFYTRYAHMLSVRVKTGQRVQQGDVIGYIGNTGLSTGPHVHYEVHIGSDVVDPYRYLNIRDTLIKPVEK